jgi:hypothetical protein
VGADAEHRPDRRPQRHGREPANTTQCFEPQFRRRRASQRKPAAGEATTTLPAEPMHRDNLTLADVMGHSVVQPFRYATSLGKPTRSPSYLPSSVFSRTLVDLLTPGSTEPTLADIEAGVRALENSPKLQQSLSSIIKATKGEVDSFISSTRCGSTVRWIVSLVRTSGGPNVGRSSSRSRWSASATSTALPLPGLCTPAVQFVPPSYNRSLI